MVISSAGGATQRLGGALGQYEYHEDKGHYVQTSTEQSDEGFDARYLYRDEDYFWWVFHTPGEKNGYLRNDRTSPTLPTGGWQYWDGDSKSWQVDRTLIVTPRTLKLPRQFTVTATGAAAELLPSFLGVFNRTERWWLGRPVYANTEGELLYYGPRDKGWVIGDTLGNYGLRGSSRHSPANVDRWRYWTGSEDKPASVTVTV